MTTENVNAPDRSAILETRLTNIEKMFQENQTAQRTAAVENRMVQLDGRYQTELKNRSNAIDVAETELAKLTGSGEAIDIARAQRKLTEAVANKTRVESEYDTFKRRMEASAKVPPKQNTPTVDTTNLDQWKSDNQWYGTDTDMTEEAQRVHTALMTAGDIPEGSIKYFRKIDAALREKFPEKFKTPSGPGAPTLASGRTDSGSSPGTGLRMSESMQKAARRFGMTPEEWAKSRDIAVSKGILPEQQTESSRRL